MRIHVGDPDLLGPLLEYFDRHADCVWAKVGETEVEVTLLGSYREEVHDTALAELVAGFRHAGGDARRRADLRLVRGPTPG